MNRGRRRVRSMRWAPARAKQVQAGEAAGRGEVQQMLKKPVWDFVLFRTDGSGLRMHPSWSERKVVCWPVEAHACRVEPPPAGLGRSAGRGTFRAYAFMDCKLELRFDYRKDKLP